MIFLRALSLIGFAFTCLRAAEPVPQAGHPWENSLGMKFVPVQGTGVLFSIWDTRVRDFATFVSATRYDATKNVMSMTLEGGKLIGASWRDPGFSQDENSPVCGVNWHDARAFCAWLTQKERAAGRLGANQSYRLPTDAEWSTAVGLPDEGSGTPEEKSDKIKDVYPWGTAWPPADETANYAGDEALTGIWPTNWGVLAGYRDHHPRSSPVGSYPANRFGLHDMGGNVWQWCEDEGTPPQRRGILRGASFLSHFQNELLSSHRFLASNQDSRGVFLGFRCVLNLQ